MDPILQVLLNWQFICFGLAIAAVVFTVRKVLEYLMETYTSWSKESKFWNDLVLPILPVVLGAVGALVAKGFPFPDGITSTWGKVIWGLGAGLLSGFMYRMIKTLMIQKVGAVVSGATDVANSQLATHANLPPRGSL